MGTRGFYSGASIMLMLFMLAVAGEILQLFTLIYDFNNILIVRLLEYAYFFVSLSFFLGFFCFTLFV